MGELILCYTVSLCIWFCSSALAVFRSGQIDRPVIYRFEDRSDEVGLLEAVLDIERSGSMLQISRVLIEVIDICAKEDI